MVIAQNFIPVEVKLAYYKLTMGQWLTYRQCVTALGSILQLRHIRSWCTFLFDGLLYGNWPVYTQTYFNTKIKLLRIAAAKKAERELKEQADKAQEQPPA